MKIIKKRPETKKETKLRQWIQKDTSKHEIKGEVLGSFGLDKNATEIDKIKWGICRQIVRAHVLLSIPAKELGEKMGLDKSKTSLILNYRMEFFTIDRLLASFFALENSHRDLDNKINDIKKIFLMAA